MVNIIEQSNGVKTISINTPYEGVTASINSLTQTVSGKADKTDLDATNTQLADIAISPKQYGATGGGVIDDTQAIINALAAHNTINISGGTFLVSQPITLKKGQIIKGDKSGTILIASGTSFNVFNLTYENEVYGFNISQTNSAWAGSLFTEGSKNLQGTDAPVFTNLRNKVHDLYLETLSGTFKETSAFAKDEQGLTYTVYGMWNTQVYNIHLKGYIEYFQRTWCYQPTGSSTVPWITVNETKNVVVDYPGYMFFGSKDTTTMTDPQYSNYNIRAIDVIAQCYTNSKNFAFISGGTVQFFDCIPYDWSIQNSSKQNAFLIRNGSSLPTINLSGTGGNFDLLTPLSTQETQVLINQVVTNRDGQYKNQTTQVFPVGDFGGTTFPTYKRIAKFKPTQTQYSLGFRLHNEYNKQLLSFFQLTYTTSGNTLQAEVLLFDKYTIGGIQFQYKLDSNGYVNIYLVFTTQSGAAWYIAYDPPPLGTFGAIYIELADFSNTVPDTGLTTVQPTLAKIYGTDVSQVAANSYSAGLLAYDSAKMLMAFGRDHYGAFYMPIVTTQTLTATATSQTVTLTKPVWNLTPKIIIQPLGNVTTIPYPTTISMSNQNFIANNLVSGQQYLVTAIYNEM